MHALFGMTPMQPGDIETSFGLYFDIELLRTRQPVRLHRWRGGIFDDTQRVKGNTILPSWRATAADSLGRQAVYQVAVLAEKGSIQRITEAAG